MTKMIKVKYNKETTKVEGFYPSFIKYNNIVIDEIVSSTAGDLSKVCVMYHLASTGGEDVPDTTAISF